MQWGETHMDWPHVDSSRFVSQRPHRWHILDIGDGPNLLLIHGAGGSTPTWRDLIIPLSQTHRVIALDLPGQGFTKSGTKQRASLPYMAEDISALLDGQNWPIDAVITHSAGTAIALQMAANGALPKTKIIGINPALANFKGLAGVLFPMMAKLLALNPFTANLFVATSSSRSSVERLIEGTGSNIDPRGLELYTQLIGDRNHVDATLAMMAHWSLDALIDQLPEVANEVLFITGENDKAVPPDTADKVARTMQNARVVHMPKLGHLAHEEDPAATLKILSDFLS